MQFQELHTERLRLRKLTPEIFDYVHANMNDGAIIEFLGLPSEEALQNEKDKYKKGFSTYNRTFVNFQLISKETDAIIGGCGFHTWYPEHNRAEIGYALNNDAYKQKGFMTEALYAVLKYGFDNMNLHRIEALIGPDNIASQTLVTNFNFVLEGVLREHYVKNGVAEDSLAYSLLKSEFQF